MRIVCESISMRKTIYFILLVTVLLTGAAGLQAADLKDGFFDLAWKTDLLAILSILNAPIKLPM